MPEAMTKSQRVTAKKNVTLKSVAERAGTSVQTVSTVLNSSRSNTGVSAELRARILSVAEEMQYHRNLLARAMVTGKSRTIGFITTGWTNESAVQILAGAIEAANENDYVLKVIHQSPSEVDDAVVTRCLEWRLVGALVVGSFGGTLDQFQNLFRDAQISLALIDNTPLPEWGVHFISDDLNGISQVVSHLLELGHRRIAFLGGKDSSLSRWREEYFRAAIAKAGLELPEHWVQKTAWYDYDVIAQGAHTVLRENRPTAIVCSGDSIAMVAIGVARSMGLRIPEDLSVTGYSNAILSAFVDPPLTTVDQSFHAMGRASVLHLIQCAEREEVNGNVGLRPEILLPTHLVVRRSTAPPAY